MYDIQLHNEQSEIAVDEVLFRDLVREVLQAEGIGTAVISIAVVDDDTIHKLNRQFLGHDYPTDVLSFPLDDFPHTVKEVAAEEVAAEDVSSAEGRHLEGEVILSAQTAARRAAEFHWSPFEELVLYLVHGLLHLAGYDDKTPAQRRTMRRREESLLAQLRQAVPDAYPSDVNRGELVEPHNPDDQPSQGETT